MFPNQIVTRELFSGSQSIQEQSHQNDFSQLQHVQFTQFDMSQPHSQDFFSQEQNSVSSNSQSQSIRAPAIDKYMPPKPSLFRNQSQSRISALSRTEPEENQIRNATRSNILASYDAQQLSKQKIKSKERDERDLLNSIVCMVKECTEEVKQSMKSISSNGADNADVLQSSIRAFSESLQESSKNILKAIEVKDEHSSIISSLQRKLEQRDERIQELLQMKQNCDGDLRSMLDSLKTFILDQQSETELKILKIQESTQEQLKVTEELGNSHRLFYEVNSKNYKDVKYANAQQSQAVEKRLLDELSRIRKDLDRQRCDFEDFFKNQILTAHKDHLIALEQHVERGMMQGLRQVPDKSDEIIGKWQSDLKAFCKSQQRDIENYIQFQTTEQTKQILKETQDTYGRQQKRIHKEICDSLKDFKAGQKKENMNCLKEIEHSLRNEDKRPWQNETVPKVVQDKLDDLHNYHQAEIKRLEAEIEIQKKNKETQEKENNTKNDAENAVNYILQNVFNLQQNGSGTLENNSCSKKSFTSMFKNGPGLLSPRPPKGSSWNSRALFGRTNPSPIATVLPQRKQTNEDLVCSSSFTPVTNAVNAVDNQNVNARVLRNRSVGINNMPQVSGDIGSVISDSGNDKCLQSVNRKKTRKQSGKKIKADTKKTGTKKMKVNKGKRNTMKQNKEKTVLNEKSHGDEIEHVEKITSGDSREWTNSSETKNVCSNLSRKDIFDFHDETSMGPGFRVQEKSISSMKQKDSHSETKGRWLAASDSRSDDSSVNSSPSLSVTDIFIQRQVHAQRRSTERRDNQSTYEMSNIYCSSNLTEMFADMDNQFVSSKRMLQDVRPLNRVAGKRKFYDFEN